MVADLSVTAYPAEGDRMAAVRTAPSYLVQTAHKFRCYELVAAGMLDWKKTMIESELMFSWV